MPDYNHANSTPTKPYVDTYSDQYESGTGAAQFQANVATEKRLAAERTVSENTTFSSRTYGPKKRFMYPLDNQAHYGGRIVFTPVETLPPELGDYNIKNMFNSVGKWTIDKGTQVAKIVGGHKEYASKALEKSKEIGNKVNQWRKGVNVAEASGTIDNIESSLAGGSNVGKSTLRPTKQKDLSTSCQLYLPMGFQTTDGVGYSNADLNIMGETVRAGIEQGGGIAGSVMKGIGEGFAGMKELWNSTSALNTPAARVGLARAAGMAKWATPDDLQNAIRIGLQVIVNPNTKSMFTGVQLRQLTFAWRFIATSRRESREIKNIINFFRTQMYPEEVLAAREGTSYIDGLPIGFKFPNKFRVKVQSYDTTRRGWKQFGPKYKLMYLRNVTTNFNDGTMGLHDDGEPVMYSLNCSFQEESTISKQDVEGGF